MYYERRGKEEVKTREREGGGWGKEEGKGETRYLHDSQRYFANDIS